MTTFRFDKKQVYSTQDLYLSETGRSIIVSEVDGLMTQCNKYKPFVEVVTEGKERYRTASL